MAKDPMMKGFAALKKELDSFINSYEEEPYGVGCNIGAEARRKARAEKALEEAAAKTMAELLERRKAG